MEGADEIRFPASPHHLVVLRPRGKDSTYVVPRVRVASVNQHAAATCRQLIIAEGSQTSVLQQLTLRAHRPMLKMNEAPGYREGPNGLESVGDIMHFFNPYDDRDPRDYPSELPTDAVVEERCRLPRELRRVSAGSGPRRPRMVDRSGLSWLCLVRTLGEGVEDRLGLGRDAWLGCEALVADHDGRGA